jgi:predicted RNA-binding protein with PIN domain
MPFLVDGSNVLGADRFSDDAKRALVGRLAAFARTRRTRVTLVFDGPEPPSFAKHLGSVSVAFSGTRAADDLIVERAAQGRGWSVVTSDRGLAARVQRREVKIVAPPAFLRDLEDATAAEPDTRGDWEAFFADEKNRTKF